jgi:hypothetical protein
MECPLFLYIFINQIKNIVVINVVIIIIVLTMLILSYIFGMMNDWDNIFVLSTCLYSTGNYYKQAIPVYSSIVTIAFFGEYMTFIKSYKIHMCTYGRKFYKLSCYPHSRRYVTPLGPVPRGVTIYNIKFSRKLNEDKVSLIEDAKNFFYSA